MNWIPNEKKQINLPKFGFIYRKKISNQLNTFINSVNPLCILNGRRGCGKTTFVKCFFDSYQEYNAFWINELENYNNVNIPNTKNLVLIIDDFELHLEKSKKTLTLILNQLDFKDPQFKIILITRDHIYSDLYDLIRDKRYALLFNFYEEHLIDVSEIPSEDFDDCDFADSTEKIAINETLISLSEKNIGELVFIINSSNLIPSNQVNCSNFNNSVINEIFETMWNSLVYDSLEEYGEKKSKIRTTLIMLAFKKSKRVFEIKENLSNALQEFGIAKIKNEFLEINSLIFSNWIILTKWFNVRTEIQQQRDIRKILKSHCTDYLHIIERILSNGYKFKKWYLDLLFEESFQNKVEFKQKVLIITQLLMLISNYIDSPEVIRSYSRIFFKTSVDEILKDIPNKIKQLSYVISIFVFLETELTIRGLAIISVELLENDYDEDVIEEFLTIFISFVSRTSPDVRLAEKIISDFSEKKSISQKKINGIKVRFAKYLAAVENYDKSFETLFTIINNSNFEDEDYSAYHALVSISGVLKYIEPQLKEKDRLEECFEDLREKVKHSNYYLKTYCGIEANLSRYIKDHRLRKEKIDNMLDIALKNNYTDVSAALNEDLGILSLEKGKYDDSVKYFQKAIEVSQDTLTAHGNTLTAKKIADTYITNYDFDNAEKAFQDVVKFARIENSPRELIEALISLSKIKMQNNCMNEAKSYLDDAKNIAKGWGNLDFVYSCYVNEALLALKNSDFDLFERKLRQAFGLDKEIHLNDDEKIYLQLGIIFGSEATNTNITQIRSLISDFKKKFKNTSFREEFLLILTDVIMLIDTPRSEILSFIRYIINQIQIKGLITKFLEYIFVSIITKASEKIDYFRKNQTLVTSLEQSINKLPQENEFYLACSFFLEESHISYGGYSALTMKQFFESIRSPVISRLLLKIAAEDKNTLLLGLLSHTQKENLFMKKEYSSEFALTMLMTEVGSFVLMKDFNTALDTARKLLEFHKRDDFTINEQYIDAITLLSDLYFKNEKVEEGLNTIEQLYNQHKEKLSSDEEAKIQLVILDYHFKLANYEKIGEIIELLKDYILNNINSLNLKISTIRYDISQTSLIKAREGIIQIIDVIKDNRTDQNTTRFLITIIEYIKKIGRIKREDKTIIKFYLENFKDYDTFDYSDPYDVMQLIIISFHYENNVQVAIKYSREFAEFLEPINPIIAKMFYLWEIRIKTENKEDCKSIIEYVKNIKTPPTYIDIHLLIYGILYLINEENLDATTDEIIALIDLIESLNESELSHVTNDYWVKIFVTLAPLSRYLLNNKKLQKTLNSLKRIESNEKLDNWIKKIFHWIYSLLQNPSDENRSSIANEMIEETNIPLSAKEPIIAFLRGRIDPLLREDNLLEQLEKINTNNELFEKLHILNELCELYFKNHENKKCAIYAKQMSKLSSELKNEYYLLESNYWLGPISLNEKKYEEAIKHFEKIIFSPKKTVLTTFVESSVLILEATRMKDEELGNLIEVIHEKGKDIDEHFMKIMEGMIIMAVHLQYLQLVEPIYKKLEEILCKNKPNLDEVQKIQFTKVKLINNLIYRNVEESCFNILQFSEILDNVSMWMIIIEQLPELLNLCVKEGRKIFLLELGAKLGLEIRNFTVPEKFQVFLNKVSGEMIPAVLDDEISVYWFFKSLFKTIDSFKIRDDKTEEKYELLLIVEGPTELEVLPVIFDKFYYEKIPDWKKTIGIIPLEGISKIKQLSMSDGIALTKLAKKVIVLIDSDKKDLKSDIPKTSKEIIDRVYEQGGTTFILGKQEIENYIHPAALKRIFPKFQWKEDDGLFGDFIDVKPIIQNEKEKVKNRISKTKILKSIFHEMTTDEFNEVQKVILPNGEEQMDFDLLIEKIIEALFS